MSRSPKSAAPGPTDCSDIPIQLSILFLLIIIVRLQFLLQTAVMARSHHCFDSQKTQVPRPPLPAFVPSSNLTELPMPCSPEKKDKICSRPRPLEFVCRLLLLLARLPGSEVIVPRQYFSKCSKAALNLQAVAWKYL